MNVESEYESIIKILLIGNSGVGKTNFIFRFIDNSYTAAHLSTVGFDFKSKIIKLPKSKKTVKLQIWDTAGQERFRTIISSYYKGAHGILLIFDLTETESFESLKNWLIEIEKNANKNVIKLLIGNKCDLDDQRAISFEKGKDFAEQFNMKYLETSAKNDYNVTESFGVIGKELMDASKDNENMIVKRKNITLDKTNDISTNDNNEKKGGCCQKKNKTIK
jgi:Ras-related protein Rab-1A